MGKPPRVTVLGSLNMDISVTVPRLPGPGMTVLGDAARFTPGGKGANQAVAAARLGARARMVGAVGDDDFGRQLTGALDSEGIDARAVDVAVRVPTGLAMITVDSAGENIITVAPGANQHVSHARAVGGIADVPYDTLVISAEVPVRVIRAALDLARGEPLRDRTCILNLAPAPPEASAIVAEGVDWLVVNASEAAAVLGVPGIDGMAQAREAAMALTAAGARNAVVTVGAEGAALAGLSMPQAAAVDGFEVTAVDSVGAGDTFVGALAVALAAGVPVPDAVRAAVAAGATAVTRHGAQAAMPRPADIMAVAGLRWPVSWS
ncbi:MAG TPA: PfkB family carbohydrate kinase [Streptosporangiaceae bacterium]